MSPMGQIGPKSLTWGGNTPLLENASGPPMMAGRSDKDCVC